MNPIGVFRILRRRFRGSRLICLQCQTSGLVAKDGDGFLYAVTSLRRLSGNVIDGGSEAQAR